MGDLLVQRGARLPVARVGVQPQLFGGLRIVQRRLQQREIALQVVPAVLQRDCGAFLQPAQITLGRQIHAGNAIELGELAFPDQHRQAPVEPGRGLEESRVSIHEPSCTWAMSFAGIEETGAGTSRCPGNSPGRCRCCCIRPARYRASRRGRWNCRRRGRWRESWRGSSGNRVQARSTVVRSQPSSQEPFWLTGTPATWVTSPLAGISMAHPVRRRGEREFVDHHLLLVGHAQRHPGTAVAGVAQIGADGRRGRRQPLAS